ncbi:MAG TPA: cation-transporting P-type ATPase [Gammaproteobacteria bacterium]|nr:cation-transporting P-type ATPase [Gammaproteobacteria bacterium]
MSAPYFRISAAAALERLQTDPQQGLTESDVRQRRLLHGSNVLAKRPRRPVGHLFTRQLKDPLTIVLVAAAAFSYYLGDFRGGTILLVIVLVNTTIGSYQEYRAEQVLELLQTLLTANTVVIRDGTRRQVEQSELVPGDIVVLEEGGSVPADLRLIETHELGTNDFMLTGESLPHERRAELVIEQDVDIAGQDNLVFCGTTVTRGNALGVVFATGMDTAIGNIAHISQTIRRDDSPLQQEIGALAKTLTKLAGLIALTLLALNVLFRAEDFDSFQSLISGSLIFAIGVAAACVPQGLPAQISVALSLGISRLAAKHAVVKRLSAVETLGSTTVICSDKTGTITTNEMTIVRCWMNGRQLEVGGEGYEPSGDISADGKPLSSQELESIKQFFTDGFLASRGTTHPPDAGHRTWYAVGDPTEAAFMPLAIKAGLDPRDLEERFPVIRELSFDSARQRMTIVRRHKGRVIGYMKGATTSVLDSCDWINRDGEVVPMTDADRASTIAKAEELGTAALRVIALAYRDFPPEQSTFPPAATETDFVFAGLVAMHDPPRPGVKEAVRLVHDAHVRLFMITGDDAVTAQAIAARIGMQQGRLLTGYDLRTLSDADLQALLTDASLIFSRVSPQDKYRIVRLLKQMGEVVAVTGDGVNDTLSLKQADIGVAMGGLGSDIAKEAAEVVLLDDNFGTLVIAIREGRTIYQNLQRVILSSITSNLAELSCVCFGFIGAAAGLPIPITAVQILAIDLIGEMLPLMALTFDPPASTIMQQPPRKLGAHILHRRSLLELFFFGTLMGAAGYFSFYMVQRGGGSLGASQAAAYGSIVLVQYANILSRRTARSVFGPHSFSNGKLWMALVISLFVILLIINVSAIGAWFGFEPMRPRDWIWPVIGTAVFLLTFEIKKALRGASKGLQQP